MNLSQSNIYMSMPVSPIVEFSPAWFDDSSKAWRANKIRKGEGWVYRCAHGECKRRVGASIYCFQHKASPVAESIAERVIKRHRALAKI